MPTRFAAREESSDRATRVWVQSGAAGTVDAGRLAYRKGTRYSMGAITEIDVLWITAGLGCDGDTIAMTAATQPSLEDLVFGALPFVPKIKLHNPFLAYENGEEFMQVFHRAAEGRLAPFILVIEGSIPNEKNKKEGYWATFGTDQKTGQPILTCDWIDRLAPNAWAVIAAGTISGAANYDLPTA